MFTKIKNSFLTHNRLKNQSALSLLGAMTLDKETDYKIEKLSPLAYPLENKGLDNDDIRDFYQLSYMDCLPDAVNTNEKSKSKKLINKPKI